jgi:hypothetical protein
LWCIIDDFHSKSESAVVVNQCKSKYFSVTEGGHQGGVLSGILYIAFINDLLFEMNKCNIRTGIGNLTCNAPALADDIACIATSPRALQRMLDVCSDYSNKWRFQFNGNKSCVVQFTLNAPKPDFKSSINGEPIPVSYTYIHLDFELNGNFKSLNRTRNVCRKARNTNFAMSNIRTEYTNPLALIKLYKTLVIPSCLYECEVWNNLKNQDSRLLNRLQHFIAKHIQQLPKLTRSDICESLVGLNPITCEIEKRKLYFFGKLCNMNSKHLPKKMFLNRLCTCVFDKDIVRYGFAPDILDIVQKYDLSAYITDYLLDGQFPGKLQWKKVVSLAVQSCQQQSWTSRVTADSDFSRFINIHNAVSSAKMWSYPTNSSELRTTFFIAKLIPTVPDSNVKICRLCEKQYTDIFVHVCCNCQYSFEIQNMWWDLIIENFCLNFMLN